MKTKTITGARIVHIARGATEYPAAIYAGPVPAKGATLNLTLENGVTYSGVVYDATEADGKTLVEFTDGLLPQ